MGSIEQFNVATLNPDTPSSIGGAVGGDGFNPIFNTTLRGQRVSVVAPSVLVKTLDAQKPNEEFEKLPAIPRPTVAARKPVPGWETAQPVESPATPL